MVKDIMKQPMFLAQVSAEATAADSKVADDLFDTLKAHSKECVGMFEGFTAQIIQHEIDHCNGIVV